LLLEEKEAWNVKSVSGIRNLNLTRMVKCYHAWGMFWEDSHISSGAPWIHFGSSNSMYVFIISIHWMLHTCATYTALL